MEDIIRKLNSNPFAYNFVVDIVVGKDHVQFLNFDKVTIEYFEAIGKIRSIVNTLEKKRNGLIVESITFRYSYKSKNFFEGGDFIALLQDFVQSYSCNSHIRLYLEPSAFDQTF